MFIVSNSVSKFFVKDIWRPLSQILVDIHHKSKCEWVMIQSFVGSCFQDTHHKPYHVESNSCLLRFDRCTWCLLIFWVFGILFCFFFVNNLQVLYVNPGCNRIISGLKSSLANKNLLIILFTFIHLEQNITQKWYLAQRNYVPLLAQQCVCLLLLDKCWYYAIAHFTLWRKNYFLFLFFEALPYPFYYFCLLKENFTLIYEIWLLLINYNFL